VSLTKRETVILSMLCRGMSMEDICEELDITYDGLKKHNRNIYRKLGAKNRAEAERKAAWLGLVHRRKFTKT
ncbi:MAG: response regulator transcription factor, partial [Lachnospiraceae bacterium]|nr:response regulator transcription factor [Lachnospiraceae bacterium]